jgi:hypothetical protein
LEFYYKYQKRKPRIGALLNWNNFIYKAYQDDPSHIYGLGGVLADTANDPVAIPDDGNGCTGCKVNTCEPDIVRSPFMVKSLVEKSPEIRGVVVLEPALWILSLLDSPGVPYASLPI